MAQFTAASVDDSSGRAGPRAPNGRLTVESRESPENAHGGGDGPLFSPRGNGNARISVAVCEEHEILRAGLVALLAEDRALEVTAVGPEQIADNDVDVAIVSSKAARNERFQCRIVICSDEPEARASAFAGNDVAGVLHRGSLTVSQLLATVHAAAAGLRVQAQLGNGSHTALDPRAVRVLELMADGCSTREIAMLMNYSERTIKKLITELEDRLQTRTRAQTVAHAIRRGLI